MQAIQKRHSTMSEALLMAQSIGAYRTILTHFSQRYPRLPPDSALCGASNAIPAFDGMCVPLIMLPDLPKLLPALTCALEEEEEEEAEDVLQGILAEDCDMPAAVKIKQEQIEYHSPGFHQAVPQHIRFMD